MDFAIVLVLLGIIQLIYIHHDVSTRDKTILGSTAIAVGLYPLFLQFTQGVRERASRNVNPFKNLIYKSTLSMFGSFKDKGWVGVEIQKGVLNYYMDDFYIYSENISLDHPCNSFFQIILGLIYFIPFLFYITATIIPYYLLYACAPCDPFSAEYQVRNGPGYYYLLRRPEEDEDMSNYPVCTDDLFIIRNSVIKIVTSGNQLPNNGIDSVKVYFYHKEQKMSKFPLFEGHINLTNLRKILNILRLEDQFIVEFQTVINDYRYCHCKGIRDILRDIQNGHIIFREDYMNKQSFFNGYASVFALSAFDINFIEKLSTSHFGFSNLEIISSVTDTKLFYRSKPECAPNKKWKRFTSDVSRYLYDKHEIKFKNYDSFPLSQKCIDCGYYEAIEDKKYLGREGGLDKFCRDVNLIKNELKEEKSIEKHEDKEIVEVVKEMKEILKDENLPGRWNTVYEMKNLYMFRRIDWVYEFIDKNYPPEYIVSSISNLIEDSSEETEMVQTLEVMIKKDLFVCGNDEDNVRRDLLDGVLQSVYVMLISERITKKRKLRLSYRGCSDGEKEEGTNPARREKVLKKKEQFKNEAMKKIKDYSNEYFETKGKMKKIYEERRKLTLEKISKVGSKGGRKLTIIEAVSAVTMFLEAAKKKEEAKQVIPIEFLELILALCPRMNKRQRLTVLSVCSSMLKIKLNKQAGTRVRLIANVLNKLKVKKNKKAKLKKDGTKKPGMNSSNGLRCRIIKSILD